MGDYGFELPDVRKVWMLKKGDRMELVIERLWREAANDWEEDNDLNFDVCFHLVRYEEESSTGDTILRFPVGKGQGACEEAVRALYGAEISKGRTTAARVLQREHERNMRYGF